MSAAKHPKPIERSPWEIACEWPTQTRTNFAFGNPEPIDPGANFFVVALEALGATTRFSCEGHPRGFYVAFEAPYELAQAIHGAGFFSVEIEGPNSWSIRKPEGLGPKYTEKDKRQTLAWASKAWMKAFGPFLAKHPLFVQLLGELAADEARAFTPAPARKKKAMEAGAA